MKWPDAEAALRAHIETEWAVSAYAAVPLAWENEPNDRADSFVAVMIEGTYADKTIFGSTGKRSSIEAGIVFFHAFVPVSSGKATALGMVAAMTGFLELQSIAGQISLDGANPPSPVEYTRQDMAIPTPQPGGMYFRCSGSVPFIVLDQR